MIRAIDALFEAFEPRAVCAAKVADIVTWALIVLAITIGIVYGTEWAAAGFRVMP
jgi:hypothetical protein